MAKKTHEQFMQEFKERNTKDITILGTYTGSHNKILCRCNKCNHEWETVAKNLILLNRGCPKCVHNAKKTHEDFLREFEEKSPFKDTIDFLSEYKNSQEKIYCKCKICDTKFYALPSALIKYKACPSCYINTNLYTHEEFLKLLLENNPHYDDFEFLEEYKGSEKKIKYKCNKCGNVNNQLASALISGHGCKKCGRIESGKKISNQTTHTHEEFLKVVENKNEHYRNGTLQVLGKYVGMKTKIKCYCSIHDTFWNAPPDSLKNGCGCPTCGREKCANSKKLSQEEFEKRLYEVNPDIRAISTYETLKIKIKAQCQFCKHEWMVTPNNLLQGQGCPHCSDGISYPNKFSYALLEQLPVKNVIHEYSPKWIGRKRYDNYFEYKGKSYILEMDGAYHYSTRYGWNDLKSVEKSDEYKDKLALEHNIQVIRIECLKSEKDYIKNNILQSELSNIFELSDIDWNKCDLFANKNLIKEICDYFNKNSLSTVSEIVMKYGISENKVRNYLHTGTSLGLCNYSHKIALERKNKKIKLQKGKVE